MNIYDYLLSTLIIAAIVCAVIICIKRRKNGNSCCGNCGSCDKCSKCKNK